MIKHFIKDSFLKIFQQKNVHVLAIHCFGIDDIRLNLISKFKKTTKRWILYISCNSIYSF